MVSNTWTLVIGVLLVAGAHAQTGSRQAGGVASVSSVGTTVNAGGGGAAGAGGAGGALVGVNAGGSTATNVNAKGSAAAGANSVVVVKTTAITVAKPTSLSITKPQTVITVTKPITITVDAKNFAGVVVKGPKGAQAVVVSGKVETAPGVTAVKPGGQTGVSAPGTQVSSSRGQTNVNAPEATVNSDPAQTSVSTSVGIDVNTQQNGATTVSNIPYVGTISTSGRNRRLLAV